MRVLHRHFDAALHAASVAISARIFRQSPTPAKWMAKSSTGSKAGSRSGRHRVPEKASQASGASGRALPSASRARSQCSSVAGSKAGDSRRQGSSSAASKMDSLPGVRLTGKRGNPGETTNLCGAVCTRQQKRCKFLCGSVCFQTPDPVSSERRSIRWAYDAADSVESTGQGANDWFCERAWSEQAPLEMNRDRVAFQEAIAIDKEKLTRFLARRDAIIERCLKRATTPKRRGGTIVILSTMIRTTTL